MMMIARHHVKNEKKNETQNRVFLFNFIWLIICQMAHLEAKWEK